MLEVLGGAWNTRAVCAWGTPEDEQPALRAALVAPLAVLAGDPDGAVRGAALDFWHAGDAALPPQLAARLQALLEVAASVPEAQVCPPRLPAAPIQKHISKSIAFDSLLLKFTALRYSLISRLSAFH